MAVEPRRRRRPDDDDAPLAVVPPDVDDLDDDDEDDGPEVDADEGMRHARRYSRAVNDLDGDEESGDQLIPDRVVKLALPKPWTHLKLWVWLDYPEEVARLFGPKQDDESDDEAGERIIEGLRSVVVKHGGWSDRQGRLPQPSTRAFWNRVSTPLSKAIISKLFEAIRRNPTPAASEKRTRRR